MIRVILVGKVEDVLLLARVATAAMASGKPEGGLLGLRFGGEYFSAKWGKASITVRRAS